MAQQKFQATDIKGLTPGVDPTQSDSIFVVAGRNYSFDARGPKSAFGNRLLLPQPRLRPEQSHGYSIDLRNGERTFTFDGDGISEWDEVAGGWDTIYSATNPSHTLYRWTYGYLAGLVYFCNPAVGILVYDPDTRVTQPHESVGIGTPTAAIAVTVNNGRLAVLTSQFMAWSNPSDGLDFTPKLGGAGFQLLSDRVSGAPITITSYSGGTLCWTTGGVLRSDFTGDAAVYRHRSLDTEYRPANSFCWARIDDDTTLILDERGLFQVKSGVLSPYSALFNEFLIGYVRENRMTVGENMRLDWDNIQRNIFVSVSQSYRNPIYERTFVLYEALDKWGEFSERHYGILPVQINRSQRAGDYYGFVDSNGNVRYWTPTFSRELAPADADYSLANLWYPTIQSPTRYVPEAPGTLVASHAKARSFALTNPMGRAGYYDIGSGRPIKPQLTGLDSYIELGYFRPLGPSSSDQMSEIVNILVRNILGGADFTSNQLGQSSWQLQLVSSITGFAEPEQSFQVVEPMLAVSSPGVGYYACSVVGVWHSVRLLALEIGESYHLQTLEITAANAGRLL